MLEYETKFIKQLNKQTTVRCPSVKGVINKQHGSTKSPAISRLYGALSFHRRPNGTEGGGRGGGEEKRRRRKRRNKEEKRRERKRIGVGRGRGGREEEEED